jgi:hypothetical protein
VSDRILLAAAATAVLLAGCGGSAPAPSTPTAPLVPLRAPHLQAGWRRVVTGALSFGIPPGWTAASRGGVEQVRSADRALALTVALDRHAGGVSPSAYVAATLRALPGYTRLRRRAPQPIVDTQYSAASASATGTLRATGVRQRIIAIALAPSRGTICSLLAFSTTRAARTRYVRPLTTLVRTVYVTH